MPTLVTTFSKALRRFHRMLRQSTYESMSHQAADWMPDEMIDRGAAKQKKPIEIDFAVAKKNRLFWIRRTLS